MSAAVISRAYRVPRGATALGRASIGLAEVVAQWAAHRAQRRRDRRVAMLAAIQDEQTRKPDPSATDHALAQMGMRSR